MRYFDEQADDTKPSRYVCKNCGAEGQHKTYECPVQIVRGPCMYLPHLIDILYIKVFDLWCSRRARHSQLSYQ